jgi:hypothetical protein
MTNKYLCKTVNDKKTFELFLAKITLVSLSTNMHRIRVGHCPNYLINKLIITTSYTSHENSRHRGPAGSSALCLLHLYKLKKSLCPSVYFCFCWVGVKVNLSGEEKGFLTASAVSQKFLQSYWNSFGNCIEQCCGAGAASFGRSRIRSRNAMRLRRLRLRQWYLSWLRI